MASGLQVFTGVFPIVTLALAIGAQLAGTGRLPRNHYLGIRMPSTMASDEGWRAGHAAAARPAWIGFVVILVAAILSWITAGSGTAATAWAVAVFVILVATLVWVTIAATRGARSVVLR